MPAHSFLREDTKIRAIFNKRPSILQRTLVLVFLSIALLFLDSHDYLTKNIRYWLQAIVSPLQYTVNLPSMLLHKAFIAFTSHEELLRENQALKTQVTLLTLRQQNFLNFENENKQLRALLNASKKLPVSVDVAEVLFVAANAYPGEWILNKGNHDGVYVGQAVLDASGVLGQVIMVGPNTSRVMLISDTRSSIPVENLRTGLRSILQGNDLNHPLSLMFIPKTEKVNSGDVLISSGAGTHFPKGYPVGEVIAVENQAGEQFLTITVKPIAQLDRERFVLLVGDDDV